MKCSICGKPGATLPCKDHRTCGQNYHLPCAREAALAGHEHKQFPSQSPVFSAATKEVVCPVHASMISEPIQEPAGVWLEALGGWDGQAISQITAMNNKKKDRDTNGSKNQGRPARRLLSKKDVRMKPRTVPLNARQNRQQFNKAVHLIDSPAAAAADNVQCTADDAATRQDHGDDVIGNNTMNGKDVDLNDSRDKKPQRRKSTGRVSLTDAVLQPISEMGPVKALQMFDIQGHTWELGSCVDRLPPLRAGEGRMLGVTMSAPVYAKAQQSIASFLDAAAKNPGYRYVVALQPITLEFHAESIAVIENAVSRAVMSAFLEESQKEGSSLVLDVAAATEAIATADWEKWMKKAMPQNNTAVKGTCNNNNNNRNTGKTAFTLPETMSTHPSLQMFKINKRDRRRGLAQDPNAMGVRVRKDKPSISPFQFIGPYAGLTMFPIDSCHFAKNSSFAIRLGFQSFQELSTQVDVYSADFEHLFEDFAPPIPESDFAKEACQEHNSKDQHHWLFTTAYLYGNITSLINDPAIDPFTSPEGNFIEPPNCNVVNCLVWGWPFQFLVNFREIKPNKELLYCYGSTYWNLLEERIQQERSSLEELRLKDEEYRKSQEELKQLLADLKLARDAKRADEVKKKEEDEKYHQLMKWNKTVFATLAQNISSLPADIKTLLHEQQAQFPGMDFLHAAQSMAPPAMPVLEDMDSSLSNDIDKEVHQSGSLEEGEVKVASTLVRQKSFLEERSTMQSLVDVGQTNDMEEHSSDNFDKKRAMEKVKELGQRIKEARNHQQKGNFQNVVEDIVEDAGALLEKMDKLANQPAVAKVVYPQYVFPDSGSDDDYDSDEDKTADETSSKPTDINHNNYGGGGGDSGAAAGRNAAEMPTAAQGSSKKRKAQQPQMDKEQIVNGIDLRFVGKKYKRKLMQQVRQQQHWSPHKGHGGGGGGYTNGNSSNNNNSNNYNNRNARYYNGNDLRRSQSREGYHNRNGHGFNYNNRRVHYNDGNDQGRSHSREGYRQKNGDMRTWYGNNDLRNGYGQTSGGGGSGGVARHYNSTMQDTSDRSTHQQYTERR